LRARQPRGAGAYHDRVGMIRTRAADRVPAVDPRARQHVIPGSEALTQRVGYLVAWDIRSGDSDRRHDTSLWIRGSRSAPQRGASGRRPGQLLRRCDVALIRRLACDRLTTHCTLRSVLNSRTPRVLRGTASPHHAAAQEDQTKSPREPRIGTSRSCFRQSTSTAIRSAPALLRVGSPSWLFSGSKRPRYGQPESVEGSRTSSRTVRPTPPLRPACYRRRFGRQRQPGG